MGDQSVPKDFDHRLAANAPKIFASFCRNDKPPQVFPHKKGANAAEL
jgi:hypothetical protein